MRRRRPGARPAARGRHHLGLLPGTFPTASGPETPWRQRLAAESR
ncbi:hypothetical protein [Ornithinimicrobium kibberense]